MIRSSGMPRLPINSFPHRFPLNGFTRRLYHAGAAILCAGCVAGGAIVGASASQQPIAQFSTGVQLVEVYATVTDANGGLITGLKREDFEVQEDQELQEISAFAAGEFPLTVVLGIDRSWSMAGDPLAAGEGSVPGVSASAEACRSIDGRRHRQRCRGHRAALERSCAAAACDRRARSLEHDITARRDHRDAGPPGSGAGTVGGRRVLGRCRPIQRCDRRAVWSSAHVRVRRSSIRSRSGENRPPLAAELAVVSGGRSFLIRDARALDETFTTIARELRYQYLLGYTPMKPGRSGAPEWRSIRVAVKRPIGSSRARTRRIYRGMTTHPLVIGLFDSADQATSAARALRAMGVPHERVSIVARSHDEEGVIARASGASPGSELEDSATASRIGELGAHLLSAMALVMPGIGPIVADGPLAAGLAEAAGHVAGGVARTLERAGLIESEADTVGIEDQARGASRWRTRRCRVGGRSPACADAPEPSAWPRLTGLTDVPRNCLQRRPNPVGMASNTLNCRFLGRRFLRHSFCTLRHRARSGTMDTSPNITAMSTSTERRTDQKSTVVSEHLTVRPENDGPSKSVSCSNSRTASALVVRSAPVSSPSLFVIGLVLLIGCLLPERVYKAVIPPQLSERIVWLSEPGPGGGGGGGNKMPDPPKPAEIVKPKPAPVAAPVPPPPVEPPPVEPLTIPLKTLDATVTTPGTIESTQASNSVSLGSGTGTGAGPGQGSGIGEGFGGGTGGGAYRPGNGVMLPKPLREVKPQYTADAMRAKVQGTVLLECVVLPDGTVGKVEVVRSLDSAFGLDQEAIKAAKQWRFAPGHALRRARGRARHDRIDLHTAIAEPRAS